MHRESKKWGEPKRKGKAGGGKYFFGEGRGAKFCQASDYKPGKGGEKKSGPQRGEEEATLQGRAKKKEILGGREGNSGKTPTREISLLQKV